MPQDRDGTFSTELFGRYQRNEQALVLALLEMDLPGVSTRKVAAITEQLCGTSVSKSQVSALTARLDTDLTAWRERPLSAAATRTWPWMPATSTSGSTARWSARGCSSSPGAGGVAPVLDAAPYRRAAPEVFQPRRIVSRMVS